MAEREEKVWLVGELLATTGKFLADKGSGTPRLDAELLLARVLGLSKVQLYVNFERPLSPDELGQYRELVRRRAGHEPVAYILERKEFYGLNLKCGPAALIPRPETELLVDEALSLARRYWPGQALKIADIGCGAGPISLALAKNLPEAEISAVDVSPQALSLARENAAETGLAERVRFYQGDLLAPLPEGAFHLICANLPYIPSPEMKSLMPDVGLHEPHLALDGGPLGLDLILRLLDEAEKRLEPNGHMLLEIWPDSLAELSDRAQAGGWTVLEPLRDLAGWNRIVPLKR